jgi:SnoaL-like polyketide cyclase
MSIKYNNNIQFIKSIIDTINTGDTANVSDFIGPTYYNHESQMDPVRSKMRGPEEFFDTVRNLRKAISDLHYELIDSLSSNNKVITIVCCCRETYWKLLQFHSTFRKQNIISSSTYVHNW